MLIPLRCFLLMHLVKNSRTALLNNWQIAQRSVCLFCFCYYYFFFVEKANIPKNELIYANFSDRRSEAHGGETPN